jgi:hypothetical protein
MPAKAGKKKVHKKLNKKHELALELVMKDTTDIQIVQQVGVSL